MNLPNWLTTLRIVLALFCVFFVFFPLPYNNYLVMAAFVMAALTDSLDGYAARVRKEITSFGKFFDPLADKILIIAVLCSLTVKGFVPKWAVLIICAREVVVTVLRLIVVKQGVSVGASSYGKIKTFTQILAVGAYIIRSEFALYMLWAAIFFTLFSGMDYIYLWVLSRKTMRAGAVKEA
ncbi:MAG: CDP-diacylglycerol--glycerol-3-phosphate 3-phosphatidyltransferase [Bacillota bacterium]